MEEIKMSDEKFNWGNAGFSLGSDVLSTGLGLLTNNMLQKQNYKWSERAAEASYQRQLDMYNRMYEDKSPANVVKQLEEAGLSKSLMFSGGAGGVGGAAQGATAPQNQQFGVQGLNKVNLAMTYQQLENLKAEAELTKEKAETERVMRPEQQAYTHEQGKSIFIENTRKKYEDWYSKETNKDEAGIEEHKLYGSHAINADSLRVDKMGQEIYNIISSTDKATAEKLLTDKKINGYLQELAIAQQNADSQAIQAAAQKLASEFNYGEYTNWKWWAGKVTDVAKIIK